MLDLWQQVWGQLGDRGGRLDVRWCKSHATFKQVSAHRLTPQGLVANGVADFFAGEAAKWGALPADKVREIYNVDENCLNVVERLLDVSRHVSLTCPRTREDRLG